MSSRKLLLWSAAALVAQGACAIPDSQFQPTPDLEPGPGAPPVIVLSASSIEVVEAMDGQVMVSLDKAPAESVSVTVSTLSKKLALSRTELVFSPETYAQPQAVTLTALPDADAAKDDATVTFSATGLDTLSLSASLRDDDVMAVVSDIGATGVVTIDEAGTAEVRVHLAAQPLENVRVDAILAAGPVTIVGSSSAVFTPQNYDVDQVITFSAADDANVVNEDVGLTFRSMGLPDKVATLRSVDDDTLNLSVAPSSLQIVEQGTPGAVSISLTQQPSANVTVNVTTTTGQATLDRTQLTFTPQNYATQQTVSVSAPADDDVAAGSDTVVVKSTGLTDRTTSVTIADNDTQQIVSDASPPLTVAENGTGTFGVTLRFRPTADVLVSVSSLATGVATVTPGLLRFTSADYATAHPVTVKGTDDNNLAVNSTTVRLSEATLSNVDLPVNVTDDDTQRFLLSASSVTVPEGMSRTFDVSLAYDPGTTVTCSVTSSNATSLAVSPSTVSFSSSTYTTAARITVTAPVDSNDISEMADVKVQGCGAPVPGTVMAMASDGTQLRQYGWPMPFTATANVGQGTVLAYKLRVDATSRLDSFGIYVPTAVGDFRMALYSNNNNAPDGLVAQMSVRRTLVNGSNTADIPDVDVPIGDYWVVLRVGQTTAIGLSPVGVTGSQCVRNLNIPSLDDPWPTAFGAATCGSARLYNLWINNYFQQ